MVDLVSEWRDERAPAPRLHRGRLPDRRAAAAAAYFPEANVLVPLGSIAPGSRTPTSKSIVIEVLPSAP